MRILGIETSCDESGVAIYDRYRGLLANQLYSQARLHSNYGGVVPELASRDHIRKISSLIQAALTQAKLKGTDIQGVAYTAGPGLVSALMVGATIGRSLAYAWNIPAIAVNHMEAHIMALMLDKNFPEFPFVVLLVSGGHTQLIKVTGMGKYFLLGDSIDDAAGEAFDKIANLLGLKYPGGPSLSCLAKHGVRGRYNFPRPMTEKPGLTFSFSGLKTFVANIIRASTDDYQTRANIARAFEEAIVETITIKCRRAIELTGLSRLVIAGGVSANYLLRCRLEEMMREFQGKVFYARPEFCTDNGAMIACTGMLRIQDGKKKDLEILIRQRWSLEELTAINI